MQEHYCAKLLMPGIWEIIDRPDGITAYVDMYLIEGADRALLFDAGFSKADLTGYINTLTDKPVELIISHGHGDHAAGMHQFDRVYMSHRDIGILNTVFGYNLDETMVTDLHGGEVFDLGMAEIEVITLPGHTYGSMVLLDRKRQLLFTSDALGSGCIWMQLPHSAPVEAYAAELRKLEANIEGMDRLKIFVGHDCQRICGFGRQYITDIRVLAERIMSGEVKGKPTKERSKIYGGLTASNGLMSDFIYKPGNVYCRRPGG